MNRLVPYLVAALVIISVPADALTINFTFGTGFGGGTDARKDAQAAAEWWMMALLTDFAVDITVALVDLSGEGAIVGRMHSNTETAAVNATTGTKLPKSATVELNSMTAFFFDPTPHDSSEFNMAMENGLFGDAKAGGAAAGKFDALSVLKHEIGHALGYSRTTGTWADGKPFTAYTDFLNNFSDAAKPDDFVFDFLAGGKEGNKTGAGGALKRVDFDADSHIDGASQPALNKKEMADPGFGTAQRSLQTPLDIDILGDAFHLGINDMPKPIPQPYALLLLVYGLAGLAAGGWTRRNWRRPRGAPRARR